MSQQNRNRKSRKYTNLSKKQPQLYCGPGKTCKAVAQNAAQAIAGSGQNLTVGTAHDGTPQNHSTSDPKRLLGM